MTMLNIPVAKINEVWSHDANTLSPETIVWALTNGLKQGVNDKHASIKRKDFDSDDEHLTAVRAATTEWWQKVVVDGNPPGARTRAPAVDTKMAVRVKRMTETLGTVSDEAFEIMLAMMAEKQAEQVAA